MISYSTKKFPRYLIFAGMLLLSSCGEAVVPLPNHSESDSPPAPSQNAPAGELRIFRSGDEANRDFLAGVYPGDQIQLEARRNTTPISVEWETANAALGSVSSGGLLSVHQAGEFSVFAKLGSENQELKVRAGAEPPFLGETESPVPVEPSPTPTGTPIATPSSTPSPTPDATTTPTPTATASDHFMDEVVSFQAGADAGFGSDQFPQIVLGAPRGSGSGLGGFHVLSLGKGGVIILKSATPILNEAGPDFIVFENAFYAGGNPNSPFAEPGEVSVSQDGESFFTFPCESENSAEQFPGCAGVHPVYANSETNDIDPTDPAVAGGDAFDLTELGFGWVLYVKIEDVSLNGGGNSAGFDLDAISIIHQ